MINCILLAAGSSSRFGSPKALAIYENETIIKRTQSQLLSSNINNIIIVLGDHAQKIQPFVLKHKRVKVVYNNHHNFGQTSSFKCGVNSLPQGTAGILLLPIDFPFIEVKTYNYLITEFQKKDSLIVVPTFKDRKGHPPLFDISLKSDFDNLDYSEGINSISHIYSAQTKFVPVEDNGVILSFNTPDEFENIKRVKKQ